jgi:predicted dehydrogenase
MRILIVGLGSIGRRHLANLKLLDPDAEITVWRQHARPDTPAGDSIAQPPMVYSAVAALASRPDVAFLTGPASSHIASGLLLAEQGVHLFIEKPLSHDMEGVGELIDACRRKGLVMMVGYNLRFHETLRCMKQALSDGAIGRLLAVRAEAGMYLPDWRGGTDYRRGVSARSALGGGAVLELSHELDYARWFGGEVDAVCALAGRVSNLEIDVEDMAEIILRFENGVVGSVHVDMVQRAPVRSCRLIGTEGTLCWDGISNAVTLYSAARGSWSNLRQASSIDRNEMYLAEAAHFLDCVSNGREPSVSGEDGRRALALALAVKRSSSEQAWVVV